MTLRSLPSLLSLTGALTIAAAPALAQGGRSVDEGTFVLARGGAAFGSESFQVLRVPGQSALMRITAQRTVGEQRTASALTADSMGTPQAYSLNVKRGNATELTLTAMSTAGRLSSKWQDQRGNEAMKEFVVAPSGTVVLDDELVSQFYFVALQRRGGPVKVIVPRAGREHAATLVPGGLEGIEVGGRNVTATKYTLTGAGGGGSREFWVDAAGRLLRVALPGGVTATREEIPR